MIRYWKNGWNLAWQQPFVLIVLLVYHFAWGFALYRYVAAIVTPLLYRYPQEGSVAATHLFWAEAQFRLTKTDLALPYLYGLVGLLLLRWLMTPLVNAGVYYSLHEKQWNAGYRFCQGVKALAGPFMVYALARLGLLLAPLIWIIPAAIRIAEQTLMPEQILLRLLPYAIGWIGYGYIIQLLFIFIHIARMTSTRPGTTLAFFARHAGQILILGLVITVLSGLVASVAFYVSLWWAGFVALVCYQGYRFIVQFLKLWSITTQYQLWISRN